MDANENDLRMTEATWALCRRWNAEVIAREMSHRMKDRKWSPGWLAVCLATAQEPGLSVLTKEQRAEVIFYRKCARRAFERCDSPLEEVFLAALIGISEKLDFFSIERCGTPCRHMCDGPYVGDWPRSGVRIFQQFQVGAHRVDFAFTSDSGQKTIVELDGHAFHSTREALQRDKARDRELQAAGYSVLRFTYDDVWGDADAAAEQVHRFMSGEVAAE